MEWKPSSEQLLWQSAPTGAHNLEEATTQSWQNPRNTCLQIISISSALYLSSCLSVCYSITKSTFNIIFQNECVPQLILYYCSIFFMNPHIFQEKQSLQNISLERQLIPPRSNNYIFHIEILWPTKPIINLKPCLERGHRVRLHE